MIDFDNDFDELIDAAITGTAPVRTPEQQLQDRTTDELRAAVLGLKPHRRTSGDLDRQPGRLREVWEIRRYSCD